MAVSVSDRALAMLSEDVVECFRHQRLEATALPPRKRMHRKRHFGCEESCDLLAPLPAGRARLSPLPARRCPDGLNRHGLSDCAIAQIGEGWFAAHATVFPVRDDLEDFADMPTCLHVHS